MILSWDLEEGEDDALFKKIGQIIREGDGNRRPGYDQLTYRILKECEQEPLIKWLINTFRVQTKFGLI